MRKLVFGLGAALVLAVATPAFAAPRAHLSIAQSRYERSGPNQPHVIGHPEMVARYEYVPLAYTDYAKEVANGEAGLTIPFWTNKFVYQSVTYPYMMVGKSPFIKKGGKAKLKVQIYAYVLTFSDSSVFDPTVVDSNCDTESAVTRLLNSPLYNNSDIVENGVDMGNVQYEDALMRGEFWQLAQNEPKEHTELKNAGNPVIVNLTVPAADGFTKAVNRFCNGAIGEVDQNWLAGQISTAAWKLNEIPVVLLYNVFQTQGQNHSCCVLGYHGSFHTANGLQTYSVTTYSNSGIFSSPGIQDIHATTHEYGELLNDPNGNNGVPAWGHVGQVSGCQSNLEVGDPLTGTVFGSGITLNNFLYHPQELVYYSWFSRDNPSLGAGGLYSMNGTFTSAQGVCH